MIPQEAIVRVRESVRLSEVVGRRVKLRKSGRSWVGLCCFHDEKTPSLSVDDQRGTWKCFGCDKGGDSIEFLRLSHGYSFTEAVEVLAGQAGITLPQLTPELVRIEAAKLTLHGALQRAAIYYQRELQRTPRALDYLKGRGITHEAIQRHGIGYAPEGRAGLEAAVGERSARGEPDVLTRAGLGGATPDQAHLRDRITFPISDHRGRIVSFAGRAITDIKPKYLTGHSSEVFVKTDILYGADLARQPAHDGAPLLVVEGYLDVIALAPEIAAVAVMGSDLSVAQLKQLWRLSDRPILCFDGDEAGRRATKKALELAFKHLAPGVTLGVISLKSGDPADHRGPLPEPIGLADAFWQYSLGHADTLDQRASLEHQMVETLKHIPDQQLREKYITDARRRVRDLARPRPMLRSNGHTLHSTNPATRRLVHAPGTLTIKAALDIVEGRGVDTDDAVQEALALLASVGLGDGQAVKAPRQ